MTRWLSAILLWMNAALIQGQGPLILLLLNVEQKSSKYGTTTYVFRLLKQKEILKKHQI